VPTIEKPGSDGGLVQTPLPKYLPPGYTLARNVTPAAPIAPRLSSGANPNASGVFTLAWESSQAATAPTYTLQQKNASGGWSTVASGLTSPEYAFTAGSPEAEGTWTYRVAVANDGPESEYSPASAEVKVDQTAPNAPTATPSREPDYAAGGGWYKGSVTVSFTSNGDPNLSDGSLGSGVNPATLSPPETLTTTGADTACGTVSDNVGNVSAAGCLTVQVDATPPSLEISCPASALVGASASASFLASDAQSGLASEPSGTVPIDTSTAGEKTVSTTAVDNVGNETTKSCTTLVEYANASAPTLSAGSSPNANGLFTLSWTGSNPMQYLGFSYTLQHHDAATEEWSTVASGIEALSYEFTGAGEEEGTWVYRVQGSDPEQDETTEFSPVSAPVVVDKTAPNAPSVVASRAPDYAGDGGWYKNSVTLSFVSNGDPALSDGSPGSGVDPASIPAPETFTTDGSHTASGTVSDNAGNQSAPASLTVQVESTPPSLEITCPASVSLGATGVHATVTASDGYSGLRTNPSGSVAIETNTAGPKTTTRTAVSNVGLETTSSCTTEVGYTKVLTSTVKGKLVVSSGEAVELTSTAKVSGTVTVKPGGALDIEGATLSGPLTSKGAALLRICGASLAGPVKASGGSGSVVIGEGTAGCSADTFYGALTASTNTAGVSIDGDVFHASVKVTNNAAGTTVTNNSVAGSLTVKGNTGTVVDHPNEVEGKSKLQ
jgi:hypothetical protein